MKFKNATRYFTFVALATAFVAMSATPNAFAQNDQATSQSSSTANGTAATSTQSSAQDTSSTQPSPCKYDTDSDPSHACQLAPETAQTAEQLAGRPIVTGYPNLDDYHGCQQCYARAVSIWWSQHGGSDGTANGAGGPSASSPTNQ